MGYPMIGRPSIVLLVVHLRLIVSCVDSCQSKNGMPVQDSAGPRQTCDNACCGIAFRLQNNVCPRNFNASFGAQWPMASLPFPLSTLQICRYRHTHMTRGQYGSLILYCKKLSFSTLCRIITARLGNSAHRRCCHLRSGTE